MISTFKLEAYLSKYEFTAPYLLCCSDAETMTQKGILENALDEHKFLWDNLSLGYTEDKGMPELREAIAKELYPKLEADNILCFAGAQDAIHCAMNTLCSKGDHVIVLTPAYQSLHEIPSHLECEVSKVALKEENAWKIKISDIKSQIRPSTKLIIINFPHNPTGQVLNSSELKDLVKLCQDHDIWLFSDEVYRLLGENPSPWSDPAACAYNKAISLGVMSKAFGLPGLRIGWIASQSLEILESIKTQKHYTSICNSAPAEILSLMSIHKAQSILQKNNRIVSNNLKILDSFFNEYSDTFTWVRPRGGCTGLVRYKGSMTVNELCQKAVEQEGVLLLPGFVYDLEEPYFRIGFGRKNMPEALERFKRIL